ncbi:5-(carboxyamino)imidazole ribonucleotide mutase [Neomoorella thermoacetica]|uniref:5-(carboxyamino)imidazole ribonucleotide mutase n=1 Tax=Neomoorella thermoacetica TaxID=1525 RepID=UPI0008FBAFB8|nr:5-(carboxyamino)imidazole ribonucleotide mutase [Moorella thermoacetica]APC09318.1 N5-carboxyaminoimidazole ribonucleotide mutase [Moorella thermoacetica]
MNLAHVGIVMGSDSDLPIMVRAAAMLDRFQIPYEVRILSAHRSPDAALDYARNAAGRGLKVIIAGAGGAAHLAGVLAAVTTLPVIGVPIRTAALGGVDSLYAMVQMPRGIPVATVAIDGAANAAILAAQILAVHNDALRERLAAYKQELAQEVAVKDARLAQLGIEGYLGEEKK